MSAPGESVERQFFGRVAAQDTVSLAFEVGGELTKLNALEGTSVSAGTILAELDVDPFERAVERAELQLAQATRDVERTLILAERNVASEVGAENAETARDLAEVALRDARAALADARIVAPFDGLIADRIASAYTIVEPGQPILRLHDMSEIRVEFDLPERLLRQVGDPERVSFVGLRPGDDAELSLEFREFRVETGPIGQSYTLSLAITGDNLPRLLPGQTMIVRAAVPNPDPRPALPASAIATSPDGRQIVVAVEADGNGLVARHIEVDVEAPRGSVLLVAGLEPDTEIVAVGAHAVPDGARLVRYPGLVQGTE
ncbi:efflux RND transporter periplasmic adaptor subunit [Aestuariibius sp. 2305UL40-4]|uniref:efflux RND transporter periplasmic adaptor subunit n=1 Tax=Aestuariibius violaceus TaxID=3234132 RepID=UPI00345EB7BF